MATRQKPVTLALLTCEQIKRGADGFIEGLMGLRHGAVADDLPFTLSRLWVYWEVTGLAAGQHEYRIVVGDENLEVAATAEWAIEPDGEYEIINKCARLQDITFPVYGIYSVRVICDGETVAVRPFAIVPDEDTDDADAN
ncbi:MAG TPA: hypothetical protein VGF55_17320 [Gemmataceae bacterium]|jgi:hypothetical protein